MHKAQELIVGYLPHQLQMKTRRCGSAYLGVVVLQVLLEKFTIGRTSEKTKTFQKKLIFFCDAGCLNHVLYYYYSFWGQFEERQHKPQTHVIHMGHQLFHLLNEPAYDIRTVHICTEDVKELVTTQAEEEYQKSFKTNVFVAVFTTARARLNLYEALET